MSGDEEIDLYSVLNLPRTASKAEIKKAYHKAALSSHPDKVPDDERPEAEIKFKAVSQAYEILNNDDTRAMYDQHGMAAFDKGSGANGFGAGGPDLDDILAQMFGAGGGGPFEGMHGSAFGGGMGGPGGARRRGKGKNEIQQYEVTPRRTLPKAKRPSSLPRKMSSALPATAQAGKKRPKRKSARPAKAKAHLPACDP